MEKKILKNIEAFLLIGGLAVNSFAQDTLRNAEGYIIRDNKGALIQDVREGNNWKNIYEYDNGKLTKLTTFSEGVKTQLYVYNEKGQLTKETIFNKEGKAEENIKRNDD